MKDVQWSNEISVGVELIDEQHKMWIQHLNNLAKSVESQQGPAKITETLSFLIEYTHFHFSTEEKHMVANNYEEFEQHKMKHDEFKTTLGNLEEDFIEEGSTPELADAINTLLGNWLIKHIREVDVEFGAFLRNNRIIVTGEG